MTTLFGLVTQLSERQAAIRDSSAMLRRNHFLFGLLALMLAVFVYAFWINAR